MTSQVFLQTARDASVGGVFANAPIPPDLTRDFLPLSFEKNISKKRLTYAPSIGILHKSVNH